ncbi:MAG: Uma2 family endonuclease [Pirellulaceae bacterium]|jgi:Uma2 family endonuclease|nr:Uma2 family endonuclease [Pirellulaceae bacterium]
MISEPGENLEMGTDALGQPAWRVALLYPRQGSWTEADYLGLEGGPLVEFDDGVVEVLEMPTKEHQRIAQFLYRWLYAYVLSRDLGEVFLAPLPIQLWQGKFREPDVFFVRSGREEHLGYPVGADLVIEVVSSDRESRRRDTVVKRSEYARAGIAEYWIVDPEFEQIEVLVLGEDRESYRLHGQFVSGQTASSGTLTELAIAVDDVLESARVGS